jgi:Ca2+-binding RTX toxin-like protein
LVNIEYIIGTDFGDVFNGDGDDNHLIAGLGNDTLNGFGGNDTLDGGADNDVMNGGAGNDTFIVENAGDQVIDGAGQGLLDRILTSVSYGLASGAEIEELVSTAGNSSITLVGNEFGNRIVAGGGNDTMTGNAGNDTFVDGGGNDVMDGCLDTDTVDYSAAGSRVVVSLSLTTAQNTGGGGTDTLLAIENIIGTGFNDILNGTAANNVFDGGDGHDALNGLSGNDALTGGLGNDTLDGGDGNDVLAGGDGNDSINGGNNNDNITGGLGNDTIVGGAGNETVDGGAGRDRMTGGLGNDFYTVDDAGDVVTEAFNEGTDTVSTTLASLVLATNVERLVYIGTGAFVGIGNSGDNRLNGNARDDRFVDVADGNDTVSGGAGSDSMDFRGATTGVVLNFVTGVHGGAAAGDLYGSIEKYFGSNTADDVMTGGGAGRFVFTGFGGNDTLTGAGNIDQLQGQAGDDSLSGLGGVDSLDGGAGNDTLSGGAAKDYFVYSAAGFGQDVITDFQDGFDKLKVHSSIGNNISAFNITGNGSTNVVLTQISSPTNTITINSAAAINITALDFQFY